MGQTSWPDLIVASTGSFLTWLYKTKRGIM